MQEPGHETEWAKRLAGGGQDRLDLENLERVHGALPMDPVLVSILERLGSGDHAAASPPRRVQAVWLTFCGSIFTITRCSPSWRKG